MKKNFLQGYICTTLYQMIYLIAAAISLIEKQVIIQTIMTLQTHFLFRLSVPLSLFTTHILLSLVLRTRLSNILCVVPVFWQKATVSLRMYSCGCEEYLRQNHCSWVLNNYLISFSILQGTSKCHTIGYLFIEKYC